MCFYYEKVSALNTASHRCCSTESRGVLVLVKIDIPIHHEIVKNFTEVEEVGKIMVPIERKRCLEYQ